MAAAAAILVIVAAMVEYLAQIKRFEAYQQS
jgi:hypothetical protein